MSNDLLHIVDIDHEGRGVAKKEEKTFFIHNALIGEKVEYKILKKKKNIFFGIATHIENPSPVRADPSCPHYNLCGGCSMQHFKHSSQIEFKNNAFFQTLKHIGKVAPEDLIEPIFLEFTEYRHKARLRAKYVEKKDKVLVGFNERLTHFLTDMDSCEVLPGRISSSLVEVKSLIKNLSIYNRMPQIEYASNGERDIFIFRILDPLSNDDIKKLSEFSTARKIEIWTQSKGPETVMPLFPERDSEIISYPIANHDLNLEFNPSGFIQINPYINQMMIDKALELLNLNPQDEVVDFFSGLGNFTLPIARYAHTVIGIEGSEDLVNLGQKNAVINNLSNVTFQYSNLFELDVDFVYSLKNKNKWLLDPPRDGAMQLLELISKNTVLPEMIVYVSCNPATLARDANILVNDKGYKYQSAGILNMFPHTSHIESISLFTYED